MDPEGKAARALMWMIFGVVLLFIFLMIMMDLQKPA